MIVNRATCKDTFSESTNSGILIGRAIVNFSCSALRYCEGAVNTSKQKLFNFLLLQCKVMRFFRFAK